MLTPPQQALLDAWLPGASVAHDHTWGELGLRAVLELQHGRERYVLKAGGPDDGHMAREIRAHHSWLSPWASRGRVPAYVASDAAERMLLTRFLPGSLVEGSAAADDPDTFRQAGALLRLLHDQPGVEDSTYEQREADRSLTWLAQPHRIEPSVETRLRDVIASWDTDVTVTLVPTHGDWQPRNWIIHDGVVSAIDLGRADLRPAATDLARLAAHDFRRDPSLEAAFLEGYGPDPRSADPDAAAAWHRMRVREAIGTAVWSFQVGDERFEQQGHRMITEALADLDHRFGWYAVNPDGNRIADDDVSWQPPREGSVIRFMGDHGATVPLWGDHGLMFDDRGDLVRELGVRPELATDIEAWGNAWQTEAGAPHMVPEAHQLVRRLNEELGDRYRFVYRP